MQTGSKSEDAGEHRGWYSRGYLPHFDSSHTIQHITYRLADSLPAEAVARMKAEVAMMRGKEAQREAELRRRIEEYLDAGHGCCILWEPKVARMVVDSWFHFDGERYRLLEWVIMPNHCHVLIEPFEGVQLGKIVLSWKNYTARHINEYRLRIAGDGEGDGCRTGVRRSRVWQRDYWDRFVRDERHFNAVCEYIWMNPVKAGLAAKPEDWYWSSIRDMQEGSGKVQGLRI